MELEYLPTLEVMQDIYRMPLGPARFSKYLQQLQGESKLDMLLPIGGFNPMAKDHALDKVRQLENIDIKSIINELAPEVKSHPHDKLSIGINLADDLMGGWTQRYTSDYDSKFKTHAHITRGFCAPFFWTSEDLDTDCVRLRIREYVFRSMFQLEKNRIKSLSDHLSQELYVSARVAIPDQSISSELVKQSKAYYETQRDSEAYNLIFNFFYGDEACDLLNYPTFGYKGMDGFSYARFLANTKNRSQ